MNLDRLQQQCAALEADSSLFENDQLRRRFEALDQLDGILGAFAPVESAQNPPLQPMLARATTLRLRLEDANLAIVQSVRRAIQNSRGPENLLPWIDRCRNPAAPPAPGLAYDALDEFLAGVLGLREPRGPVTATGPEQVFYQPTPARHILDLINRCGLSADDLFLDLGAGLGQVCILVSLLTGARSLGIEVEPAYVASARSCALDLGIDRASFVEQDARQADLSQANVFYFYTPFTGSILKTVLHRLQRESTLRPIKLCTFGPCSPVVAQESWLRADGPVTTSRIAIFFSAS